MPLRNRTTVCEMFVFGQRHADADWTQFMRTIEFVQETNRLVLVESESIGIIPAR